MAKAKKKPADNKKPLKKQGGSKEVTRAAMSNLESAGPRPIKKKNAKKSGKEEKQ